MTEQLMDNAVRAHEYGMLFEEFCNNEENEDLAYQLGIPLEHIWEMADYVVNYLKPEWQDEAKEL